jgi:hypothetical protein
MSKEREEELFRALNTILDAVTALNLMDLEAEAAAAVAADQGETSTQGTSASSKGKAKVADPDWEDIPSNPVPITPLSSRPRFSQVVGSSLESPVVPSSPVSVAVRAMANAGGAQPAGANQPPPLAYATGVQFNALWALLLRIGLVLPWSRKPSPVVLYRMCSSLQWRKQPAVAGDGRPDGRPSCSGNGCCPGRGKR